MDTDSSYKKNFEIYIEIEWPNKNFEFLVEFIAHQINTIEELKCVPKEYGIEVDLRDYGDRLILQHDPFKDGENFEEYLRKLSKLDIKRLYRYLDKNSKKDLEIDE